MFTKRELYLIARAIFEYKQKLKKNDGTDKVKMSVIEFDDYLELSVLHLKIKDFINER